MLRKETVLLAAVVALVAAAPAHGADPGPRAAGTSFWEQVTATVVQLWARGAAQGQKTCESGPGIDPLGCPRSAPTPPICEGGGTIDPSGCPRSNRLFLHETAGGVRLAERGR